MSQTDSTILTTTSSSRDASVSSTDDSLPYIPTASELRSAESSNMDGLAVRWQEAMNYFHKSCASFRIRRTPGSLSITAVIDISGSMDGVKLVAVKLGICAIVANLSDDDEMNIVAFSVNTYPITNGFKRVSELKVILPNLLQSLDTDGSTACYDAIVESIHNLREHLATTSPSSIPIGSSSISSASQPTESSASSSSQLEDTSAGHSSASSPIRKAVTIALTDGEDNASRFNANDVEQLLINPGINKFMFVMVAVGMSSQDEAKFRRWMDLMHCKQVSVSVRTGNSLVGVFKETLLSRIFHSDITSTRFLQESGVYSSSYSVPNASDLEELRSNLVRQIPGIQTAPLTQSFNDPSEDDFDDNYFNRCYSNAVSVSNSPRFGSPSHTPNRSRSNSFDGDNMRFDDLDSNSRSFDDDYEPPSFTPRRGRASTPPPHVSDEIADVSDSNVSGHSSSGVFNFLHRLVGGRASTPPPKRGFYGHSPTTNAPLAPPMSETMLAKFPKECICPITMCVMQDPVMCDDGHSYERGAIQHWLTNHGTSPLTNLPISNLLVPNHALRSLIETIKSKIENEADPSN